jgi:hypothetical protein
MDGLESQAGRYEEEKNVFPLPEIESRLFGRPDRNLVAVPAPDLSVLKKLIRFEDRGSRFFRYVCNHLQDYSES